MGEKSTPKPAVVTEIIPSQAGQISALASANAPFIYFEAAPNFAWNGEVANITLEVARWVHVSDTEPPQVDRVTVAHLRMAPSALRALKTAIEGIEMLMKPAASGEKN